MLATIMSTVDTNGFIAATTLANLISRDTDETSPRAPARARWGILGTAIWAVGLALVSESVVDLWHGLGSIGTPALLLPLLSSLFPRLRITRSWILPWIAIPGIAASTWLFSASGGVYWFGIEPIYIGLSASLLIRAAASLAERE